MLNVPVGLNVPGVSRCPEVQGVVLSGKVVCGMAAGILILARISQAAALTIGRRVWIRHFHEVEVPACCDVHLALRVQRRREGANSSFPLRRRSKSGGQAGRWRLLGPGHRWSTVKSKIFLYFI